MAGNIVGYDGSGYPIYDHFGKNAPKMGSWRDRFLALQGRPKAPMTPGSGVRLPAAPLATPPMSTPPVSGAPAGAASPVVTPGQTQTATVTPPPHAAMGRINQAMAGPPEPPQGPPEPPSSSSMLDETDPAVLEQILGLGDKERQLALAEKLRDQKSPDGNTFWSRTGGQMYVAASPFEHAATAYGKFRGKRDADKIGGEQIDGRMKILDILKKQ